MMKPSEHMSLRHPSAFSPLLPVIAHTTKALGLALALMLSVSSVFAQRGAERQAKIALDLKQEVAEAEIQQQQLRTAVRRRSVIVQTDGALNEEHLQKLQAAGARIKRLYHGLNLAAVEIPLTGAGAVAGDAAFTFISPDRPITATGHLEVTTGAAQVRALANNSSLDGRGIGIAVLDSGIEVTHQLLMSNGQSRVVYSRDFTGQGTVEDTYGHGTHIASLIAGSSNFAGGAYTGIAPGANLLNLRVLDDQGRGTASSLLAAIDWCITNKDAYNLRVITMSLGAVAVDSYTKDPLCLAVRRAHDAGILVIAAAGNQGKDRKGRKVYGGIHSPGIDPSVITVGAANTFSTDQRSDDTMATYSSHGPTRGYTVSANGVKHYDNLFKPDLVAPGNKLTGASSMTNGRLNTLASDHPNLRTGSGTSAANQLMSLSGTSVATPVVAGAAALLFQANPKLTPNLVKALLMYSAQPLRGFNSLEQGAGLLNVDGAVRLAQLVPSDLRSLSNGQTLIADKDFPRVEASTIASQTVYWGQGVILNYCFAYGKTLLTHWQQAYTQKAVLS
ncbi:MAG: S8 family peptidase, partial [Deltaproteobacteria bacterium]|nr:S8 family peptidase [Deltaproteobacteria bacterium]